MASSPTCSASPFKRILTRRPASAWPTWKQSSLGANVDAQAIAHIAFQRMWAQYVVSQEKPGADAAKIQEQWLTDLQAFVEKYPNSSDTAEALLQLGMYQEFVGKTEEAGKWYQQLVRDFPKPRRHKRPGARSTG